MSHSTLRFACAALLAAALTAPAQSAVISYSTQSLGGNTFQNTYQVAAEPGEGAIAEFTIFFAPALYAGLFAGAAPPGFDALAIEPDPALPGDGFFDALALGGAIDFGAPQGGFSVRYTFLGAGLPGSQRFDIVDPASFATISTGHTIPAVPEPGRLPMLVLGAAGLLLIRRHAARPNPLPR